MTNPRDPASCAQGEIVFDADHWSVALPCCRVERDYSIVSSRSDRVTISSEGAESQIRLDADGTAHWDPGFGYRVRTLTFTRAGASLAP